MRTKKEIEKPKNATCGECAHPKWDANNRDFQGKPFCGRCKFSTFGKIINGAGFVLDNMKACENFNKKEGAEQ